MKSGGRFSWLVWAGLILLGLYAALLEPNWLELSRHREHSGAASGVRVVQLSDLHLKQDALGWSEALGWREQAVLRQVRALDPGLVVLSGDVIERADGLALLDEFLQGLAGLRVVAVLGNWEHWGGTDRQALAELYRRHGVSLLVNADAVLDVAGRRVRVAGLDDATAGVPEPARLAVSAAGEADLSILIQHSPGFFERPDLQQQLRGQRFDLCLAGHTHGGQIVFFGWAPRTPPGSGQYLGGRYPTDVCPLHVSRGIGTSVLPLRFGARPEIAVFEW